MAKGNYSARRDDATGEMLQSRPGLSERRAHQLRRHRSTERHVPVKDDPDSELRACLGSFASPTPHWGYRRAHAVLVREGHYVNRKKIQRLRRGLRFPSAVAAPAAR